MQLTKLVSYKLKFPKILNHFQNRDNICNINNLTENIEYSNRYGASVIGKVVKFVSYCNWFQVIWIYRFEVIQV
jgi:hypothetical protein